MKTIRLHDKNFRLAIPNGRICDAIGRVADRINKDYAGRETPLFVGVLNGSFMFMAELMQRITLDCEASFVKIASYSGTASTGKVHELIGLSTDIRGRHVVIVEDIVDTGASIEHTVNLLKAKGSREHRRRHAAVQAGSVPQGDRDRLLCAESFRPFPGRVRARLRSVGTQSERYLRGNR